MGERTSLSRPGWQAGTKPGRKCGKVGRKEKEGGKVGRHVTGHEHGVSGVFFLFLLRSASHRCFAFTGSDGGHTASDGELWWFATGLSVFTVIISKTLYLFSNVVPKTIRVL